MQRDYRRDWKEYPVEEIPSKSKLPDFLYDLLELNGVRTLLDAGCGTGKFAIDFCQRGYSVVGADINPGAVEIAKAKAQQILTPSSNYLRFYVGDINELHLEEAPFDAVLMQLLISIIGGLKERKQLLQTGRRFLKRGGLLYLLASGVSDDINPRYVEIYERDFPVTREMYTYFSRDSEGRILYTTHHFTEEELEDLLQEEFDEIEIRKEKETSSRRPDEAAYFLYVTARAK